MDQDIGQEEPIDILIAKLQGDLLNEDEIKCHVHQDKQALFLTSSSQELCEECHQNWLNQNGQKTEYIPVKIYVEQKNKQFHNLSDQFVDINHFCQEGFVQDILHYSLDQRLDNMEKDFKKMTDKIRSQKGNVQNLINKYDVEEEYSQLKQYLQNTLKSSQNNKAVLKDYLEDQQMEKVTQLGTNLTSVIEKTITQIKQFSDELIKKEVVEFIDSMNNQIRIFQNQNYQNQQNLQNQQNQKNSKQLSQSIKDSQIQQNLQNSQQQQQPVQVQPYQDQNQWNKQQKSQIVQVQPYDQSLFQKVSKIQNNEEEQKQSVGLVITSLLQSREMIKASMQSHQKLSKTEQGHQKVRVKGGGSFGYSWTGGYGISSKFFDELSLCKLCPVCSQLNTDMNSTCQKLYELEYRDGKSWWVEAWFIYTA